MEEEIRKRLLEEVNKSGHPTSIKASNILIKNGWYIKNSPRYISNETKKDREVDLIAQKNSFIFKDSIDTLIIECKKNSSCPWIFFKQNKKSKNVHTLNLVETTSGRIYDFIKKMKIFEKHPYFDKELCSYYFVGYKKQDKEEGREIDNAVSQVLGGLFFYVNQMQDFANNKNFTFNSPFFYYPIIIFEGDLFEVELNEKETAIKESNHIRLLIEREFEEPVIFKRLNAEDKRLPLFSKEIIIDIVKLNYLEDFLKDLKLKGQIPIDKNDTTNTNKQN